MQLLLVGAARDSAPMRVQIEDMATIGVLRKGLMDVERRKSTCKWTPAYWFCCHVCIWVCIMIVICAYHCAFVLPCVHISVHYCAICADNCALLLPLMHQGEPNPKPRKRTRHQKRRGRWNQKKKPHMKTEKGDDNKWQEATKPQMEEGQEVRLDSV